MSNHPGNETSRANPARLVYLAVALGAASLLLSGWTAFGRRGAVSDGRPTAGSYDDRELRHEIAELRRRVDAAKASLGRSSEPLPLARQGAGADPLADEEAAPRPPEARRIVKFEVPNRALEIHQGPDGSLSVTNTDPALTGRFMIVDATGEDGSVEKVSIVVPPPER